MLSTGGGPAVREGLLLRIIARPAGASGGAAVVGVGEVAPLVGLHAESCRDAEVQLALLCRLLAGVQLPPSLTLLEVCSALLLFRV